MDKTLALAASGLAVAATLGGGAYAQETRTQFRTDTAFARGETFVEDAADPDIGLTLENAFDSNNWASLIMPKGNGRVWRLEQQFRVREYEDRDDLDSQLLTTRLQYWTPKGENDQLRFWFDAGFNYRDGDHRYSRVRGHAQWRHRPDAQNETIVSLQTDLYDFTDKATDGLDQTRWRAGIEQRRYKDETFPVNLAVGAFVTTADADADRFAFDGVEVRGRIWDQFNETWAGEVNFAFAQRDYDGDFSTAEPLPREDDRWEARARLDYLVTPHQAIYAEVGYLQNDSNISVRDYDGMTFRVGFRARFG